MVAKIVHSKSIRAILSYNEIKVGNCEAALLMAAGYPVVSDRLSFRAKLARFEKLTGLNERTRTNAMHIILSFSPQDRLDNLMLQSLASQYMEGIGFGQQPYLLYRHYDTHNPHLHIATVNITKEGKRIETHNIGKNQSEATRKLLEELYGLVKAEDQKREEDPELKPADISLAQHGKSAVKASLSHILQQVTATYKYTSLPELNAILRQFNVAAYRGPEDSRMYAKGGLVYCILDSLGQPVSIPIKASAFHFSPTLKNLEKKFGPNDAERKPYGQRLKHQLDKALAGAKDLADYEQRLQKQGIRILLRLNVRGEVYGATFIDNSTRVVYNGSRLGKDYAAQKYMEKLRASGISLDMIAADRESEMRVAVNEGAAAVMQQQPLRQRPAIEVIHEEAHAEGLSGIGTGPFKHRRRTGMKPQ